MAKKVDILFYIETPGAEQILPAIGSFGVRQIDDFAGIDEHPGLVVAGFRHFNMISPALLPRLLLVGDVIDAPLLKEGRWFKKGLCEAVLLPINEHLFTEKVGQLLDRMRELFVEETIDKIHELYEGGFSPKELSVLHALLRSGDRGVTRKEFGDGVWRGLSVHSKTLDTHLFNLRSKLEACDLTILYRRQTQSWVLHSLNPKLRLD